MSKICQKKSKTKRKRSPATDHVAHADFGFSSGLITSHAIQVEGGERRGLRLGYRNRGEENLLSGYDELTEYSSFKLLVAVVICDHQVL